MRSILKRTKEKKRIKWQKKKSKNEKSLKLGDLIKLVWNNVGGNFFCCKVIL